MRRLKKRLRVIRITAHEFNQQMVAMQKRAAKIQRKGV